MDEDPLVVLLKFGFLAVLYLYLYLVARSAARDLTGRNEGLVQESAPSSGARTDGRKRSGGDLRAGVSPRLEVVAALGHEPGTSFEIDDGVILGRASTAQVKIDDPFASGAHARIFPRGQFMYIEDMGSTNGSYLNGRQLRRAERLKVSDVVRIGDTEYRYQE